jgi:hypothetical protein
VQPRRRRPFNQVPGSPARCRSRPDAGDAADDQGGVPREEAWPGAVQGRPCTPSGSGCEPSPRLEPGRVDSRHRSRMLTISRGKGWRSGPGSAEDRLVGSEQAATTTRLACARTIPPAILAGRAREEVDGGDHGRSRLTRQSARRGPALTCRSHLDPGGGPGPTRPFPDHPLPDQKSWRGRRRRGSATSPGSLSPTAAATKIPPGRLHRGDGRVAAGDKPCRSRCRGSASSGAVVGRRATDRTTRSAGTA